MKCQAHEGGITAGKIILDGVVDQTNQLTVAVYQNWDEQVTLQKHICQDKSNKNTSNNSCAWSFLEINQIIRENSQIIRDVYTSSQFSYPGQTGVAGVEKL